MRRFVYFLFFAMIAITVSLFFSRGSEETREADASNSSRKAVADATQAAMEIPSPRAMSETGIDDFPARAAMDLPAGKEPRFLTGRIRDSKGEALEDASLSFLPESRGEKAEELATRSDKSGAFALIVPSTHRSGSLRLGRSGFLARRLLLRYLPDSGLDLGEIRLDAAPRIHGVVLAGAADPVAEAILSYSFQSPSASKHVAMQERIVADSLGRFEFLPQRIPDGLDLVLRARTDGSYGELRLSARQRDLWKEPITLRLEHGRVATGRVVDRYGNAIPQARVAALAGEFPSTEFAATTSDERGLFSFSLPRAKKLRLVASAPGFVPGKHESEAIDAEAATIPGSEIVLLHAARLQIQAFDAESREPIEEFWAGLCIETEGHGFCDKRKGEHGTLDADELSPGSWAITVRASRYEPFSLGTMEVGESQICGPHIVLMRREAATPPGIHGRILHRDGSPAQGATIRLEEIDALDGIARSVEGAKALNLEARSDRAGSFRFESLRVGSYRIWGEAENERLTPRQIFVPAEGLDLSAIQLQAAATLEGILLDESGIPAPNAWVEMRRAREANFPKQFASTDTQGRFRFSSLFEGEYVAVARKSLAGDPERDLPSEERIALIAGETRSIQISLRNPITFEGRILSAHPLPSGTEIRLRARLRAGEKEKGFPLPLRSYRFLLENEGRFLAERVVPGFYRLTLVAAGESLPQLDREMEIDGTVANIEIRIP